MKSRHLANIRDVLGRDPVHPFPARMAPGIALDVLRTKNRRQLRVLDPMMGSGTALAVARLEGHRAIGIDIDPLAVLLAGVWTSTIDPIKLRAKAARVLKRAQKVRRTMLIREAYPRGADASTRRFIRYWFDKYSRQQLASLATSIERVRDKKIRNGLWCAFSRLIITKQSGASLAMDLSHSRPHKVFETSPIKPFNKFLKAVDHVAANCVQVKDQARGPATVVRQGDARRTRLPKHSVDVVLTSPPYLNAIDYMRCSKFSLVWMGYSVDALCELRSRSIGSEVGQKESKNGYAKQIIRKLRLSERLSTRHRAVLTRFIEDLYGTVSEASRVLIPGGKAVYVVGENTVRGTYIANAKIIVELAQRLGLGLLKRTSRKLPSNRRYLPPPATNKRRAWLDGRMRREVVLIFEKPRVCFPEKFG